MNFSPRDIVDIVLVTLVIYYGYRLVRQSRAVPGVGIKLDGEWRERLSGEFVDTLVASRLIDPHTVRELLLVISDVRSDRALEHLDRLAAPRRRLRPPRYRHPGLRAECPRHAQRLRQDDRRAQPRKA